LRSVDITVERPFATHERASEDAFPR